VGSALPGRFTARQSLQIALVLRVDAGVEQACVKKSLSAAPANCPDVGVDTFCGQGAATVDWRDDLADPLFMVKTTN
jgi:hypothetical protein